MKKWRVGFLGVTALAIFLELLAVFDGKEGTEPWTSLIINYIPAYIGLPLISIFAFWLVYHFTKSYGKKKRW